jgi:hypothetical protein
MALVFVLRKPDQPERVSLNDLIELGRLYSADFRDAQRFAVITGLAPSDDFVAQFAQQLEIPIPAVWVQRDHLAISPDTTNLAVALVLASASVTSASVYDCNSDRSTRLRSFGAIGQVANLLGQLTREYGRQESVGCERTVNQLREASTHSNSVLGSFFRELVDPTARFFRSYNRLMMAIPSSKKHPSKRLSVGSSLEALNLQELVLELRASTKLLADSSMFFNGAREAVSFFNVGVRCLNDLGSTSPTRVDHAIKVFLSWASVYCIAASKACAEREDIHAGLLHAFRGLEFYVLAHLWQSNRLEMERGHFSIDSRRLFGFKEIWEEFQICWPGTPAEKVVKQLERLREQRNLNFLTHGFLAASLDELSMARGAVKAAIAYWESKRSDPLIVGPLFGFFEGERWGDDLGQTLAVRTLENAGYSRIPVAKRSKS